MNKRVVVTGMGIISPLGLDIQSTYDSDRYRACNSGLASGAMMWGRSFGL
jgi:3-oxoacyl-(acyl-carrier-protein) synthase